MIPALIRPAVTALAIELHQALRRAVKRALKPSQARREPSQPLSSLDVAIQNRASHVPESHKVEECASDMCSRPANRRLGDFTPVCQSCYVMPKQPGQFRAYRNGLASKRRPR